MEATRDLPLEHLTSFLEEESVVSVLPVYPRSAFPSGRVAAPVYLSLLENLSLTALRDLYVRTWRRPHHEFALLKGLHPEIFAYWLQVPELDGFTHLSVARTGPAPWEAVFNFLVSFIRRRGFTYATLPFALLGVTLRQLTARVVVFLDYNNSGAPLEELLRAPPPGLHCFCFLSRETLSARVTHAQEAPWFTVIRAPATLKNAADHDMTFVAAIANETLPPRTDFLLLSADRFAEVLALRLRETQPARLVRGATVRTFDEELAMLAALATRPVGPFTVALPPVALLHGEPPAGSIPLRPGAVAETRVLHFLELLPDEYRAKDQHEVLLSVLGSRAKQAGVSMEKGGLRLLVDEALHLGTVRRVGTLGTAAIHIERDALVEQLARLRTSRGTGKESVY